MSPPAQRRALLQNPGKNLANDSPTPTADHKQRAEVFDTPHDVAPGFYYLISSLATPAIKQPHCTETPVWISNLSLVLRSRANQLEGFVLEATRRTDQWSQCLALDRQSAGEFEERKTATDEQGFFNFSKGLRESPRRRPRAGRQTACFNDLA